MFALGELMELGTFITMKLRGHKQNYERSLEKLFVQFVQNGVV